MRRAVTERATDATYAASSVVENMKWRNAGWVRWPCKAVGGCPGEVPGETYDAVAAEPRAVVV